MYHAVSTHKKWQHIFRRCDEEKDTLTRRDVNKKLRNHVNEWSF